MYVQKALGDEDRLLKVRQCQVMETKNQIWEIPRRLLEVKRAQVLEVAARDRKPFVELQHFDAKRLGFLE